MSKILRYFDQLTLNGADLIISDTKAHAAYFIEDLGCDSNKVQTLYLSADNKYYYPKNKQKPKSLEDRYIVLYFGSVLPLQGTEILIEAINLCKQSEIFYILIGPLNKSSIHNKNVMLINWLPQGELSDYIAIADLCLAGHFSADIKKARRTIPGKAYIYEAMEKVMILGDNLANRERYPKYYSMVDFVMMGSSVDLLSKVHKSYRLWANEKR